MSYVIKIKGFLVLMMLIDDEIEVSLLLEIEGIYNSNNSSLDTYMLCLITYKRFVLIS